MPGAAHSHRRLFIAMAASSGFLAVLLWFLSEFIGFVDCNSTRCFDRKDAFAILLEIQKDKTVDAGDIPAQPAPTDPEVRESTDTQQPTAAEEFELDVERDENLGPPGEIAPKRDWYAIAEESALHSTDELFRNEETRKNMWRQTRSVMFADTGDFDFHEPAPVIPNLEFRVPVGVLGVGVTIGGCFIGIPLAGIPVEERTAGPNVIYCKDQYQ